jgi:hypothetical protein
MEHIPSSPFLGFGRSGVSTAARLELDFIVSHLVLVLKSGRECTQVNGFPLVRTEVVQVYCVNALRLLLALCELPREG